MGRSLLHRHTLAGAKRKYCFLFSTSASLCCSPSFTCARTAQASGSYSGWEGRSCGCCPGHRDLPPLTAPASPGAGPSLQGWTQARGSWDPQGGLASDILASSSTLEPAGLLVGILPQKVLDLEMLELGLALATGLFFSSLTLPKCGSLWACSLLWAPPTLLMLWVSSTVSSSR